MLVTGFAGFPGLDLLVTGYEGCLRVEFFGTSFAGFPGLEVLFTDFTCFHGVALITESVLSTSHISFSGIKVIVNLFGVLATGFIGLPGPILVVTGRRVLVFNGLLGIGVLFTRFHGVAEIILLEIGVLSFQGLEVLVYKGLLGIGVRVAGYT